jgi:hypothetical protein
MRKADGKKKTRKKRAFDCVEMKRKIQAQIYEEIKGLTQAEELAYWRKSADEGPWGDWWREVHERARPSMHRRRRALAGRSRSDRV